MRRKLIPPFLMLFAGAITSITMWVLHYETKTMLSILLGVLVVFYIIGSLLRWMLDVFDKQNVVPEMADEAQEQLGEAAAEEEGQEDS